VEKDKAIKIGLLLIIMFGILYWGFNFLKGKNIFTEENTYFATYERIDGLQKNSSIYLRGHKVGQVTDIQFSSNLYESITLTFAIDKSVQIPANTIARIFSSDIMGTKSIDLIIPHISQSNKIEILPNNSTLIPDIEGSITDQVRLEMAPLKKQVEKLMESTGTAIDQLKFVLNEKTGESLRTSFEKIQNAVDAMQHSSVTIDTILTNANQNIQSLLGNIESITNNINTKNKEIDNIISNFSNLSDTLAKANIAETIYKTETVMTELGEILDKVNKGEGTLGALVQNQNLYSNLEEASKKLDGLILDIQKNPKRYVSFPIMNINKKEKTEQ